MGARLGTPRRGWRGTRSALPRRVAIATLPERNGAATADLGALSTETVRMRREPPPSSSEPHLLELAEVDQGQDVFT